MSKYVDVLTITLKDGTEKKYIGDGFSSYSVTGNLFIVIKDKKWIGIYNVDSVVKVECGQVLVADQTKNENISLSACEDCENDCRSSNYMCEAFVLRQTEQSGKVRELVIPPKCIDDLDDFDRNEELYNERGDN